MQRWEKWDITRALIVARYLRFQFRPYLQTWLSSSPTTLYTPFACCSSLSGPWFCAKRLHARCYRMNLSTILLFPSFAQDFFFEYLSTALRSSRARFGRTLLESEMRVCGCAGRTFHCALEPVRTRLTYLRLPITSPSVLLHRIHRMVVPTDHRWNLSCASVAARTDYPTAPSIIIAITSRYLRSAFRSLCSNLCYLSCVLVPSYYRLSLISASISARKTTRSICSAQYFHIPA